MTLGKVDTCHYRNLLKGLPGNVPATRTDRQRAQTLGYCIDLNVAEASTRVGVVRFVSQNKLAADIARDGAADACDLVSRLREKGYPARARCQSGERIFSSGPVIESTGNTYGIEDGSILLLEAASGLPQSFLACIVPSVGDYQQDFLFQTGAAL